MGTRRPFALRITVVTLFTLLEREAQPPKIRSSSNAGVSSSWS